MWVQFESSGVSLLHGEDCRQRGNRLRERGSRESVLRGCDSSQNRRDRGNSRGNRNVSRGRERKRGKLSRGRERERGELQLRGVDRIRRPTSPPNAQGQQSRPCSHSRQSQSTMRVGGQAELERLLPILVILFSSHMFGLHVSLPPACLPPSRTSSVPPFLPANSGTISQSLAPYVVLSGAQWCTCTVRWTIVRSSMHHQLCFAFCAQI